MPLYSKKDSKLSRRKFLGVSTAAAVGGIVGGLVVGAVGGYLAGQTSAPALTVTETKATTVQATTTVTQTVGGLPPAPRTIKIGATVPLTGATAPVFSKAGRVYEVTAELINKRGGIWVEEYGTRLPVEVIYYDDKWDIPTVQKLFEKLCTTDNVDILLSPNGAENGRVASLVAEKYKTPLVETSAGATATYTRGNRYVVNSIDLVYWWMDNYLEMLKSEGQVKSLVGIGSDEDFGRDVLAGMKKKASELGFEVLYTELLPAGVKDFSPLIAKLRSLKPHVLIEVSNYIDETVTFLKQVAETNYRPQELHVAFGAYSFIQDAIPKEVANYMTADVWYIPTFPYEGVFGKSFYKKVEEMADAEFKRWPFIPIHFNALEIAVRAIELAGTLDKEKVTDTLHKMCIQTIMGTWRSQSYEIETETGEKLKVEGSGTIRTTPVQTVDGEPYIIWPPAIRERSHVLQFAR
ncbi:MAG: amino acid ABC transporter substrate-binding protein [Nitrososphaerales archaeon]